MVRLVGDNNAYYKIAHGWRVESRDGTPSGIISIDRGKTFIRDKSLEICSHIGQDSVLETKTKVFPST